MRLRSRHCRRGAWSLCARCREQCRNRLSRHVLSRRDSNSVVSCCRPRCAESNAAETTAAIRYSCLSPLLSLLDRCSSSCAETKIGFLRRIYSRNPAPFPELCVRMRAMVHLPSSVRRSPFTRARNSPQELAELQVSLHRRSVETNALPVHADGGLVHINGRTMSRELDSFRFAL